MDVCCTCKTLNLIIKNPNLNDDAKKVAAAELIVPKRKIKKFYNELKVEIEDKSTNQSNVLSVCFDYMQNLSLSKISVQEKFY